MKQFYKIAALLLVIIMLFSLKAVPMTIKAEEMLVEPRGAVVRCICGGARREIGDVEISYISFTKFYCDSCNQNFYSLRSTCKCGGTVSYQGDVNVEGIVYAEHYCSTCDNWFYCLLD